MPREAIEAIVGFLSGKEGAKVLDRVVGDGETCYDVVREVQAFLEEGTEGAEGAGGAEAAPLRRFALISGDVAVLRRLHVEMKAVDWMPNADDPVLLVFALGRYLSFSDIQNITNIPKNFERWYESEIRDREGGHVECVVCCEATQDCCVRCSRCCAKTCMACFPKLVRRIHEDAEYEDDVAAEAASSSESFVTASEASDASASASSDDSIDSQVAAAAAAAGEEAAGEVDGERYESIYVCPCCRKVALAVDVVTAMFDPAVAPLPVDRAVREVICSYRGTGPRKRRHAVVGFVVAKHPLSVITDAWISRKGRLFFDTDHHGLVRRLMTCPGAILGVGTLPPPGVPVGDGSNCNGFVHDPRARGFVVGRDGLARQLVHGWEYVFGTCVV